jgi:hypothetical protein
MTQEERLAQVTIVQARYTDELMTKANVVGVAAGLIQRGGQHTGDVGLVVLVARKVSPDELADHDMLPRELDGIPVDVQEVGEITAF